MAQRGKSARAQVPLRIPEAQRARLEKAAKSRGVSMNAEIVERLAQSFGAEDRLGGPQMVEVSRDGRRVYLTNSLYVSWDEQFYPDGIQGWAVKLDVGPEGGMQLDPNFFVDFGDQRPHQVRLQGGDSSSDSFCFPN